MPLSYTPRIVLVDSQDRILKTLLAHRAAFPFPVEILRLSDGVTALEELQKDTPDLAIIDSDLGGSMDGFALCRALKHSPLTKDLPVVLMLEKPPVLGRPLHMLKRVKGISAGADLVLYTPTLTEDFLRQVQVLLRVKMEHPGKHQSV